MFKHAEIQVNDECTLCSGLLQGGFAKGVSSFDSTSRVVGKRLGWW